jgi:hypothetical protein
VRVAGATLIVMLIAMPRPPAVVCRMIYVYDHGPCRRTAATVIHINPKGDDGNEQTA